MLARNVFAGCQMRLVVAVPAVENIKAHVAAAKFRGEADPVVFKNNVPELARNICATRQMRLVVAVTAIENIKAHVLAPEHGRHAIGTIAGRRDFPILPGNILRSFQAGHVVLWAAIENVERHVRPAKLRAQPIKDVWIQALGPGIGWDANQQTR